MVYIGAQDIFAQETQYITHVNFMAEGNFDQPHVIRLRVIWSYSGTPRLRFPPI